MFLDLLEDPWTLAGEHGISLSDFADRETPVEVDGRKDLRVVCTYSKAPWFRTRITSFRQPLFHSVLTAKY